MNIQKIRLKIHDILNESKLGGIIITLLILTSFSLIIIGTEFRDSTAIAHTQYIIGCIFLVEYLLRIWVADISFPKAKTPRRTYIFSFNGVIDLLACTPVLIGTLIQNATAIRTLRLLRLAQLLKIKPIRRATLAVIKGLSNCWDELLFSLMLSFTLIIFGATMMYFVEGELQPESFGSIPRAIWWSTMTLTTVGYGDVYPITAAGKIIAVFIAIVGIAAVAMPAGILAAAFSSGDQDLEKNIFAKQPDDAQESQN